MTESISSRSCWKCDRLCRSVARHYAKTFYFASACLDRAASAHSYRVYGFCRWVDNLVDDAPDVEEATRRLNDARRILVETYQGHPNSPALVAFRRTVEERAIPLEHFQELLDGMEMDLTRSRYETFDELELYCHRAAGVVGYIMARILGFGDPRCLADARALGIAMQLTNILRDVREDFDRGRIYLPSEELSRFGVTEQALREHRVDESFREMLRFQIERARRYYREAEPGIADLSGPSNRACVRVMSRLYSKILDAIEELGFDVFQNRARVPSRIKVWTLLETQRAIPGDFLRSVLYANMPPPPRTP